MKRENTLKLLFYFVFVVLFYLLPFSLLDSFALFKLCFYPFLFGFYFLISVLFSNSFVMHFSFFGLFKQYSIFSWFQAPYFELNSLDCLLFSFDDLLRLCLVVFQGFRFLRLFTNFCSFIQVFLFFKLVTFAWVTADPGF